MSQNKILPLGDRMKTYYEDRTRIHLPRRTYTLIRIDGKAFHTYTKGLVKPFDDGLIEDMNATTRYLCTEIQGAVLGYVQSDEISILIADFKDFSTQMWFDGNLQKMASIAASLATAKFNQLRSMRAMNESKIFLEADDFKKIRLATFDARAFQIPEKEEVINYFIWRQRDAIKNSIQSVAQANFSQRELNKVNTDEMKHMLANKGILWEDFTYREQRGGIVMKVAIEITEGDTTSTRNKWRSIETPVISEDRKFLGNIIPSNGR
jgi:tRNA(His) 5'-end guanylyltransferase